MGTILTIVSYAAMICPLVLIGLLWSWAKRANGVDTGALLPPDSGPEHRRK